MSGLLFKTSIRAFLTTDIPSLVILPNGFLGCPDGRPIAIMAVLIARGFLNLSMTFIFVPSFKTLSVSAFTVTIENNGLSFAAKSFPFSKLPSNNAFTISERAPGTMFETTEITPAASIFSSVIIIYVLSSSPDIMLISGISSLSRFILSKSPVASFIATTLSYSSLKIAISSGRIAVPVRPGIT